MTQAITRRFYGPGTTQTCQGQVAMEVRAVPFVSASSYVLDPSVARSFILTVTDGVAFGFAAPINAGLGQELSIIVRNTSGGALGAVTFDPIFKGSFNSPGNNQQTVITFLFDGSTWVRMSQAADVPL